jgi:hypothetical protein
VAFSVSTVITSTTAFCWNRPSVPATRLVRESSHGSTSVPPTALPHPLDGKTTALLPGRAGPSITDTALQAGVGVESGSCSSDACSSTSYESSTSTSGSHLHIGIPSVITTPPKLDRKALHSVEAEQIVTIDKPRWEELEAKWRRLETRRDEVRGMRAEILRMRRKTKRCRWHKDAADDVFMSFLRPFFVSGTGMNSIATSHTRLWELFDCTQRARDKC